MDTQYSEVNKINDAPTSFWGDESYIGCVVMPSLGWIVLTTQVLYFFLPLVAAIILGIAIGLFLFAFTPWAEGNPFLNPFEILPVVIALIISIAILLPVFRQAHDKANRIHQRKIQNLQIHHKSGVNTSNIIATNHSPPCPIKI
jgi:ABC-type sugar transport system permease subunit